MYSYKTGRAFDERAQELARQFTREPDAGLPDGLSDDELRSVLEALEERQRRQVKALVRDDLLL